MGQPSPVWEEQSILESELLVVGRLSQAYAEAGVTPKRALELCIGDGTRPDVLYHVASRAGFDDIAAASLPGASWWFKTSPVRAAVWQDILRSELKGVGA